MTCFSARPKIAIARANLQIWSPQNARRNRAACQRSQVWEKMRYALHPRINHAKMQCAGLPNARSLAPRSGFRAFFGVTRRPGAPVALASCLLSYLDMSTCEHAVLRILVV